jgi:hypothetical protein
MSTVAIDYTFLRVMSVPVTEDRIAASLNGGYSHGSCHRSCHGRSHRHNHGRNFSIPPAGSWRLSEALPEQRADAERIGSAQTVYWPEVDADISVAGMLHGASAARPKHLTTV